MPALGLVTVPIALLLQLLGARLQPHGILFGLFLDWRGCVNLAGHGRWKAGYSSSRGSPCHHTSGRCLGRFRVHTLSGIGPGYRLRKQLPEPVFGQIKQARGFRQFLLRGFEKLRAEWAIVCTDPRNATKDCRYCFDEC